MNTTSHATTSQTPFLDKLNSATRKVSGLYVFEPYLSAEEAQDAYHLMNSDTNFPWDLKPKLYGEPLTQHAYEYKRYKKKNSAQLRQKYSGLAQLELLCQKLEHDFDGTVVDVWCNRFQHVSHGIPWHHDTYGHHIFVLSLGASRQVEFRNDKTREISTLEPCSGDLYFLPIRVNDSHLHRVCSGDGTRISLVFFFKPPAYAKEFKVTAWDKIKGKLSGLAEYAGP